jgi:hypothetical protein
MTPCPSRAERTAGAIRVNSPEELEFQYPLPQDRISKSVLKLQTTVVLPYAPKLLIAITGFCTGTLNWMRFLLVCEDVVRIISVPVGRFGASELV